VHSIAVGHHHRQPNTLGDQQSQMSSHHRVNEVVRGACVNQSLELNTTNHHLHHHGIRRPKAGESM
jgi:hypothetical protein